MVVNSFYFGYERWFVGDDKRKDFVGSSPVFFRHVVLLVMCF